LGVEELVLRKTEAMAKAHERDKLTANWKGPYVFDNRSSLGHIAHSHFKTLKSCRLGAKITWRSTFSRMARVHYPSFFHVILQ